MTHVEGLAAPSAQGHQKPFCRPHMARGIEPVVKVAKFSCALPEDALESRLRARELKQRARLAEQPAAGFNVHFCATISAHIERPSGWACINVTHKSLQEPVTLKIAGIHSVPVPLSNRRLGQQVGGRLGSLDTVLKECLSSSSVDILCRCMMRLGVHHVNYLVNVVECLACFSISLPRSEHKKKQESLQDLHLDPQAGALDRKAFLARSAVLEREAERDAKPSGDARMLNLAIRLAVFLVAPFCYALLNILSQLSKEAACAKVTFRKLAKCKSASIKVRQTAAMRTPCQAWSCSQSSSSCV
eukprot:5226614-Amphidinium_carterae.1